MRAARISESFKFIARRLLPLVLVFLSISRCLGQDVQTILSQISARQTQVVDIRARFLQQTEMKSGPMLQGQEGEFFLLRPGRCRFRFTKPAGLDMAIAGEKLTMRMPYLNQVVERDLRTMQGPSVGQIGFGVDWGQFLSTHMVRGAVEPLSAVPPRARVSVWLEPGSGFGRAEVEVDLALNLILGTTLFDEKGNRFMTVHYANFSEAPYYFPQEIASEVLTQGQAVKTVLALTQVRINTGLREADLMVPR